MVLWYRIVFAVDIVNHLNHEAKLRELDKLIANSQITIQPVQSDDPNVDLVEDEVEERELG